MTGWQEELLSVVCGGCVKVWCKGEKERDKENKGKERERNTTKEKK